MKRLGMVDGKELIVRRDGNGKFSYYLGSEKIGICNPNTMEENILFLQNTKANELSSEIKDQIENLVEIPEMEKYLIDDKKMENEQVEELEHVLGLENGKTKRITEIELNQDVSEKDDKEDKSKKKEKSKTDENENRGNKAKDINIKQEMDLSNKTTDMKTLGKVLKDAGKIPEGKEYTKLAVVESDEINEFKDKDGKDIKGHTTRYQFVLVAKDGTFDPINLEPDTQEGDNPREENYQVKADGTVKESGVLSRYKVGEGTIGIDNEAYGEIKAYYSPRKTLGGNGIEGNKSLDIELETSNVWETDKDERDLAGEYDTGYRSVERAYEEGKNHEPDKCETETKDVDGDRKTKSHIHINDKNIELFVSKLLENDTIANVYNREDLREKLKSLEDKEMNPEKFEKLEEEIAKEAEGEPVRGDRTGESGT